MNTQEKAKMLASLLVEAEKLELKLKEKNKEAMALMMQLNESMDDEGIPSITVNIEGGEIKFDPVEEEDFKLAGEFAGKNWDDCGVFHDWLRQVGEDGLIKTKPSVHAATRKSFLKKWTELSEPLPEFIERTFHSTVKYNKSQVVRIAKGDI